MAGEALDPFPRATYSGFTRRDPRAACIRVDSKIDRDQTSRASLIRGVENHSIIIVIVVIAIFNLLGRFVRLMALIVPELSVHAVGREKLRV